VSIQQLLIACQDALDDLLTAAQQAEHVAAREREEMAQALEGADLRAIAAAVPELGVLAEVARKSLDGERAQADADALELVRAALGWSSALDSLRQLAERG